MPDNSFEHNISRQMEDFNYPSSDAVWQKLEANLQKRKKRRWAIIWFFSGLVLVGTGLYFMSRPAGLNKETIKEISLVSKSRGSDISENLSVNPKNNTTDKSSIPVSKMLRKETRANQFFLKKATEFEGREIFLQSTENIVVDSNIDNSVEADKNEEALEVLTTVPILVKVNNADLVATRIADSVSVPKSIDSNKNIDSIAVAKTPPTKETSKRSLSFGLRFEAGRSANTEFDFSKTKSADRVSGSLAGGPQTYANSFTQEPSFAWSFGAWVRKPISKKVDFQTGLIYHLYRTRASQGDSSNFTNTYHLLSLPFEIALQINEGKKLPVQWHVGIEPGWMFGSNANVQDTSGFLYNDRSIINRFQMGIQTGISFRFFQKAQHALELGPVFKYMLTPTFKSVSAYDGHLNFLGLRADWIFR